MSRGVYHHRVQQNTFKWLRDEIKDGTPDVQREAGCVCEIRFHSMEQTFKRGRLASMVIIEHRVAQRCCACVR